MANTKIIPMESHTEYELLKHVIVLELNDKFIAELKEASEISTKFIVSRHGVPCEIYDISQDDYNELDEDEKDFQPIVDVEWCEWHVNNGKFSITYTRTHDVSDHKCETDAIDLSKLL